MKKWGPRGSVVVVLIGLTLAGVYEYRTHVGRGWVRGEAFFDGRPTSYWSAQVNRWAKRFQAPEDAIQFMTIDPTVISPNSGDNSAAPWKDFGPVPQVPVPTLWDRVTGWFRPASKYDVPFPPEILSGSIETEPVLRELEHELALGCFVKQARKNAEVRKMLVNRE